ncbi:hypothetical protein NMY22_g10185 [Coprinellus aureogranulatus]|nr:hypothetical protein NMY22_g10185 [Coprinellus aureogranulatus]
MEAPQYDPRLVRRYQFARADFDIQIASLVIIYYDYLLTLPSEVKFIWTQPKKPSTYFYLFCRYSLLANFLWTLEKAGRPEVGAGQRDLEHEGLSCNTVSKTAGALAIFGHIGVLAVWGLRTHALSSDKQRVIVSSVLGFLAFAVIATLITKEAVQSCSDPAWLTNVGISTAVLVFLFELLAFIVASIRAWSSIREDAKFWDNPRKSLNYVVFSQGLLYLTAVLVSSIVTAVCNLQVWGGFARPLNSLKTPLSCLLTARFILQLRKWEHVSSASTIHRTTGWEDDGHMSFAHGAFAVSGASRSGVEHDGVGGKGRKGKEKGRRGRAEERTMSSEAETGTTMSFGVFGAGTTVGSVGEDAVQTLETARPAGTASKIRQLLGTNELAGNVGPSKSEEDLYENGVAEGGNEQNGPGAGEAVEMRSRQDAPAGTIVEEKGDGAGVRQVDRV